ncbi:SDR family oxidoreductase [Spongiibacter taiwanensis]|uniref:SDR family NAD(P)-dependent oxidoreductase n=1 Tax=Spongiibacter taiwanensis TaxID=1748242 RepID=UPI002034C6B9|nr:SDR family NAD(P)-dependent oxidoreductase [Spongiibacter taiwanensis]USA44034.1 SDR family oxidoreductase [Spongiibacter taiwanensis]
MAIDYFQLTGKTALVTGASSGLGEHFARVLASEGATVVVAARREEKLAELVADINANGGTAHALKLDVADKNSVADAFATVERDIGGIDILINNAGVATAPTRFVEMSEEDWHWVLDTNLNGAWRMAQAAAKQMIAKGTAGSIINVGSIYGLHTGVLKANYNVAKAAVVQLTKSMSMELSRNNIRVNSLCPGWFYTEMNEDYFSSEAGEKYIKGFPTKRLGRLDELTVPLLLLASNNAGGYINGSSITVDGGLVESPI